MIRNFRRLLDNTALLSIKRLQHTTVKEQNGIRDIKLTDTKTRNSLSTPMMESILCELRKGWDNEELRCIVISAEGPIWSSGNNLKELASFNDPACHVEIFTKLTEIIMSIYEAPVPVIAKVNGLAAAAGCQLMSSCDMVICSDKSTFSTPGANYGIFCSTPGIAITRTMPRLKAAYMCMTGLPLNAQQANEAGLVSLVVPEAQLDAEMEKVTHAILYKSRTVMTLGKQFFYHHLEMNLKEAYESGVKKMAENLTLPDGREGLNSFVEKRKAKWSHKNK